MRRHLVLSLVGWLVATGHAFAQEKNDAKAAAAAPAAQAPASSEEQAFGKDLTEWRNLLERMEALQVEYKTAKPADRRAIRERFEKLVHEGEGLEPRLARSAEAAYRAAPNKNDEVTDVLVSILNQDMRDDQYEKALPIAKLLIDHKFGNPRVYDQAGIAAYETNDYDLAEKYLKEAEAKNALDERGTNLLHDLPTVREKWAKEQSIRVKEAKADDLPRVEFKTSKGTIVIELFENEAPNATANFISLVEKKFYNGLTFHRVLPHFMAQGGDPEGSGAGGPGYTIACECYQPNHREHFRGSLSMAHAGRDTGGSQFFLTFGRTAHLDGKHTVFGRVISGLDVLSHLQRRDPTQPGQPPPDKIIEATVLRKRAHAYEPVKTAEK